MMEVETSSDSEVQEEPGPLYDSVVSGHKKHKDVVKKSFMLFSQTHICTHSTFVNDSEVSLPQL